MKDIISQIVVAIVAIVGIYAFIACGTTNKSDDSEVQRLRTELEQAQMERDLLSDAIRSHIDGTNGECDILIDVHHFLRVANEDLTTFDKWSYCY